MSERELEKLPDELIRELKALYGPVPARRTRRATPRWRLWAPVAAAAAVLAVLFFGEQGSRPSSSIAGDFDGDGQFDVADALLLARSVEAGDQLAGHWDVDLDGRVDTGDAQALLRRLVRPGGS